MRRSTRPLHGVALALCALAGAGVACGEPPSSDHVPEEEASFVAKTSTSPPPVASSAPTRPSEDPVCLRATTCGRWYDCVLARPQALPFQARPNQPLLTKGEHYRFDWSDRKDEHGFRSRVCVGNPAQCHDALEHSIPCLPFENPVAPDFHCRMVSGACTRLPGPGPTL